MNSNEIAVELITDRLFAKYRTQVRYQGKKRTAMRVDEKMA